MEGSARVSDCAQSSAGSCITADTMRYSTMKSLGADHCHQCAPRAWRGVPDLTGDYDLDATIAHRHNKDLPHRLGLYTKRSRESYGPRTAYGGYHGYSGDD